MRETIPLPTFCLNLGLGIAVRGLALVVHVPPEKAALDTRHEPLFDPGDRLVDVHADCDLSPSVLDEIAAVHETDDHARTLKVLPDHLVAKRANLACHGLGEFADVRGRCDHSRRRGGSRGSRSGCRRHLADFSALEADEIPADVLVSLVAVAGLDVVPTVRTLCHVPPEKVGP